MTTFLNFLEQLIRGLAAVCLASVLVLVTAQIASRFLFNFSLAAASELSIYSMIWCVFLSSAVAFRHGDHIAMEVVRHALPKALHRWLEIIVYAAVTLFLLIIVVKGYDLSLRAMRQISTAAGMPVGYVSMAMPICSVLALIFLTEKTIKQFKETSEND